MQTVVQKLFEHVREIDAGLSVGGEQELEQIDLSHVESLALALDHLATRVRAVIRVRMYPAQKDYVDRTKYPRPSKNAIRAVLDGDTLLGAAMLDAARGR